MQMHNLVSTRIGDVRLSKLRADCTTLCIVTAMTTMHSVASVPEWDIQDRLHKALRHSGLTTAQLAERLGVHRNTISNALNGRHAIDRRTILAWAMATGVSAAWLELGEVPQGPGPGGSQGWAHWDSNPEPAGSMFAEVTPLFPDEYAAVPAAA